jgi:hypothetical protein
VVYTNELGRKNTGYNPENEEQIKQKFPPGPSFSKNTRQETEFETPLTIVDTSGRILFWFLPDLISRNAQDEWYKSLELFNVVLAIDPQNVALQGWLAKCASGKIEDAGPK